MGLDSMNMGGFDADSARYDRQNRMNQPDFAPGQGSASPFGSSDIFSQPSVPSNTGGVGDIFSTGSGFGAQTGGGFGASPMGGGLGGDPFSSFSSPIGANSFGQPQQQQAPPKDAADQFWDAMGKGFKGLSGFVGELGKSFKGLTPLFWSTYGYRCMIASIGVGVVGIISKMFGFPIGFKIAIGGFLSGASGTIVYLFNNEKSRQYTSQYSDDNNTDQNFNNPPMPAPVFDDFAMNDGMGGFPEPPVLDSFSPEPSEFDDSEEDYSVEDEDEWDDIISDEDDEPADEVDGMPAEDALNTLQDVDKGMYTRQYLYDMFFKVLPNIKASFSSVKEYTEDDDLFMFWDDIIQRAATVIGFKDTDEYPSLVELHENLFIMTLKTTRPAKLKPELLADELAKAYAFETYDDEEDRAKVFAKVDTVLDNCIITVFMGTSQIISLKDMYNKCEDYILDRKHTMPVVLGVNEAGKVMTLDFKKIESIIIAGMPRSGKSWLVQAVLCQLCALNSPRDLIFYILCPKGYTSDFKNFTLPHVKRFASKYTSSTGKIVNEEFPGILDTLRYVVNQEAPRRKKIIGGNGCVNISDFRDKYPDIDMPYLYIVVDEMVTLSMMEKEDEVEYQSYLEMIVTQFPNLGIRGMFIPHEVKNQIISKTASDSVKARISVKGNPLHIEASTGTKARDFKYKLGNIGDMAVNIDEIASRTVFVHGVALTASNEKNNEIFDYLRRCWARLEPEQTAGSVAEQAEVDQFHRELIDNADSDEEIDIFGDDSVNSGDVFSNPNEQGLSGMNDTFNIF